MKGLNTKRDVSIKKNRFRNDNKHFIIFSSPWIIGLLIFTVFPLGLSLYLSFTNYNFSEVPTFIGLKNYISLIHDATFLKSVTITAIYTVVFVPVDIVLSLALATLLNGNSFIKRIVRTLAFAPTAISSVVVGLLWLWLLNPTFGIINGFLQMIHVNGPNWLITPQWLMVGIILMSLWMTAGTNMVLFLAALQGIPQYLLEAASLDGANAWRKFFHVTLPMLTPSMIFASVTTVIASLQIFAQVYVMTGGGPNYNSEFYVLYLYQVAFQSFQFGKASAMSWIFIVVIGLLTMLFFNYANKHANYDLS